MPSEIDRLRIKREALAARVKNERTALAEALDELAPALRFTDRAAALVGSLRAQPIVHGALYLGAALLWNTRLARWWRRGWALSSLARAIIPGRDRR